MRILLNLRLLMRVKPTIFAVLLVRSDSRGMPQNSLNKSFPPKEKGIDFLGLIEDFPDDSSYDSANYRSDPKNPKLT